MSDPFEATFVSAVFPRVKSKLVVEVPEAMDLKVIVARVPLPLNDAPPTAVWENNMVPLVLFAVLAVVMLIREPGAICIPDKEVLESTTWSIDGLNLR